MTSKYAERFAFSKMKGEYEKLIETMNIKTNWVTGAHNVARKILSNKARYEKVSELASGGTIPWWFIGVIHNLECSLSFNKHLHNGDSLARKTRRVPANRPAGNKSGPFTFEESAVDALRMKGFHNIKDWSLARAAYELERYNGWGYRLGRGRPLSPYLWSGSNHYTRGKFVADGKYDPTAVSKQLGAMVLVKVLVEMDQWTQNYEEIKPKSRRLTFLDNISKFFTFSGVGGLLSFSFLTDVRAFMNDHAGIILLALGAIAWLSFKYLEYVSRQEVAEGRYQVREQTVE